VGLLVVIVDLLQAALPYLQEFDFTKGAASYQTNRSRFIKKSMETVANLSHRDLYSSISGRKN
jgi:hypothetical protein